ncbi:hypothetical protein LIER_39176 [Lithospermum erythrorhizon]|uniref:Uncharacterized protein n=1 Tax=Lithospermum erythrorhizon TaxID=34254 RepID=A0AAV3QDE4_LITER
MASLQASSTYNLRMTSSITTNNCMVPTSSHTFLNQSNCPLFSTFSLLKFSYSNTLIRPHVARFCIAKPKATMSDQDQSSTSPILVQEEQEQKQISQEVEDSVRMLKNAAKTRKVGAEEILSAFTVIEKAKCDPSGFLETLGGTKSPGRTWMLIFTAEKGLKSGKYFPITAVQRFDSAAKRIENGVYVGPLGQLTFEGRFSWNKRVLSFIFEKIKIKIGSLKPFEFKFGGKDDREPSNKGKDPFFIWFYIDEEIAVARGRSGGTAFWVRCRRVST